MRYKLHKFAAGPEGYNYPLDPSVQQYLEQHRAQPPAQPAAPAEPQEESSSPLAKVLGAAATHKLVDSGLTYGVRRSGVFDNYYANAAREGLQAGLSGVDVAPKYRRGFGVVSTGLTGLGDYEASRAAAQMFKEKYRAMTGQELHSVDQLINDPIGKKLVQSLNTENASPLLRNMAKALDPKLEKNTVMEAIKRYGGMGKDNQRAASRISGAIGAGMGALTGGVHGAVGSLLSMSPDMATASLANKGYSSEIGDLKKGLFGHGMIHGVQGDSPMAILKQTGLNIASPFSGEVFEAGQNIGNIANKVFDAPSNAYHSVANRAGNFPGKATVDKLVNKGTNVIKAPAVNKIQQMLVDPAKKVIGRMFGH
jgi:hypothetical protein